MCLCDVPPVVNTQATLKELLRSTGNQQNNFSYFLQNEYQIICSGPLDNALISDMLRLRDIFKRNLSRQKRKIRNDKPTTHLLLELHHDQPAILSLTIQTSLK
jgi:hypothetical protein